jgi:glycosyltransferase involved in cell wall biosynthesis
MALREAGHRSQMLVRYKKSDDDDVVQLPPLFHGPWRTEFRRLKKHIPGLKPLEYSPDYKFNFDLAPEVDLQSLLDTSPAPDDIICLHWVNGLLDAQSIRRIYDHFRSPLVWIIHDLDPFTGGCHYSFGCDGFTRQCGACPRLGSADEDDPSHQTWLRKREYLSELPICFVAPTGWGEARVRESSLFRHARVERIPLPLDTRVFRPFDQRTAREVMQLPPDKKVILFGATYLEDRRKGIDHLIEAFDILTPLISNSRTIKREEIFLLAVGQDGGKLMPKLPFAGRYLGHVSDELMMALAYQAADIFVCPSIEDSGPMMISEAMLCETPVVAFNTGVAPDVIEHRVNGYLARYRDNSDLAEGMRTLLTNDDPITMRASARSSAERLHVPRSVAERHVKLYQSLLSS